MAAETLERWMPTSLDELVTAVQEMVRMVREEGVSMDDTVYVDVRYLSLEKRTLTDGSHAFDLVMKENK